MPIRSNTDMQVSPDLVIKGPAVATISFRTHPFGRLAATMEVFREIGGPRLAVLDLNLDGVNAIKAKHDELIELLLQLGKASLLDLNPGGDIEIVSAPDPEPTTPQQ